MAPGEDLTTESANTQPSVYFEENEPWEAAKSRRADNIIKVIISIRSFILIRQKSINI